ncbi:hypothetical protein DFJ73DRAFT_837795 [Zopfochytrium polystomum]|nr:hypothetical protein DFJ73DRAFT_837795 [Zopfochytrium polystomum]
MLTHHFLFVLLLWILHGAAPSAAAPAGPLGISLPSSGDIPAACQRPLAVLSGDLTTCLVQINIPLTQAKNLTSADEDRLVKCVCQLPLFITHLQDFINNCPSSMWSGGGGSLDIYSVQTRCSSVGVSIVGTLTTVAVSIVTTSTTSTASTTSDKPSTTLPPASAASSFQPTTASSIAPTYNTTGLSAACQTALATLDCDSANCTKSLQPGSDGVSWLSGNVTAAQYGGYVRCMCAASVQADVRGVATACASGLAQIGVPGGDVVGLFRNLCGGNVLYSGAPASPIVRVRVAASAVVLLAFLSVLLV